MAHIRPFPVLRHVRVEPNAYVLEFRHGSLRRHGRGASYWFLPIHTGLSEVPVDDRELQLLFHGRSADFQDVTVQGTLTYRIDDPVRAAERFDFSLDLERGTHRHQPLDKIALSITELAQQFAQSYLATTPLRTILARGYEEIRRRLEAGLEDDPSLGAMGLEIVSIRISSVRPDADLERALESPVREQIQQKADEAAFERRALAVEKERAIQENELNNRIELSRREEQLIDQEGQNSRRKAEEEAASQSIAAEAEAQRSRIEAAGAADRVRLRAGAAAEETKLLGAAEAERVEAVEGAAARATKERMEAYREVPPAALFALAVREVAGKLESIDHLNLSPDLLGPLLADLLQAGSRRLNGGPASGQGTGEPTG